MGRFCIFDDCSTNLCLIKPREIKLHGFPTHFKTKLKWEKWVQRVGGPGLVDFTPTKSTHTICSKHFQPSDYHRSRLSFTAVPSVPPGSLPDLQAAWPFNSSTVAISNVRSLAVPRPATSQHMIESSEHTKRGKAVVIRVSLPAKAPLLPQSIQNQATDADMVQAVEPDMILPDLLPPEKVQCNVEIKKEPAENTYNNIPTLSLLEKQPGCEVKNTTFLSQSREQKKSAFQAKNLNSSTTLLRSTSHSSPKPVSVKKEIVWKCAKRTCCVGDFSSVDFDCLCKAQKRLHAAFTETKKYQRKIQIMQLQYTRALEKIRTLNKIIKELKSSRDGIIDTDAVCSSCKKVNLCPSDF